MDLLSAGCRAGRLRQASLPILATLLALAAAVSPAAA